MKYHIITTMMHYETSTCWSRAQPPSCTHEKGSGQKGTLQFLVLEVRILQPNLVAEPWSHDIIIMHGPYLRVCAQVLGLCTRYVRKWRLLSINFKFTHTRIANDCIPAGRVSATLFTRPFLSFCVGGAGTQD